MSFNIQEQTLIVIVVYNQLSYTKDCIESIQKNTGVPYRILVVDNGSQKDTIDYLSSLKDQGKIDVIFNEENKGWIGGVNQGLSFGAYPYYCVMNNDILVYPRWLDEMVQMAKDNPDAGLVNPEWNIPKKYKDNHEKFLKDVIEKRAGRSLKVDWTRGFCFLVRREVIEAIGGLDPRYTTGYFDDWDYSIRAIRSGFKCYKALGALVFHYINVTFDAFTEKEQYNQKYQENEELFYQRWGRPLRLFVITHGLKAKGYEVLQKSLPLILDDQNHIMMMRGPKDPTLRHSNFIEKVSQGPLVYWHIFSIFMDNIRHSQKKRYAFVLCSKKISDGMHRLPVLAEKYKFVNLDEISSEDLLELIRRSKKRG